jgi:hypothetical protein
MDMMLYMNCSDVRSVRQKKDCFVVVGNEKKNKKIFPEEENSSGDVRPQYTGTCAPDDDQNCWGP